MAKGRVRADDAVGVLYWRIRDDLFPDIFLAVAAARLMTIPVMLLIMPHGH